VPNGVREEVRRRLILAKDLLREAQGACAVPHDRSAFAKGVLLLHDAAEAALGAIADHLGARIQGEDYLLRYYQRIQERDRNREVPYERQMRLLNTARNNIKHLGLFPDPHGCAYFPAVVEDLLQSLCQTYLGRPLESMSLACLIRDDRVRMLIERAEQAIERETYEEALRLLAEAVFYAFEERELAVGLLTRTLVRAPDDRAVDFPEPFSLHSTVKLLQHGVDPYRFYRFKNLVPEIGKNRGTDELVVFWDKDYGHPGNWTQQNARFCRDVAIDAILKFQGEESREYTLVYYGSLFEDVIEPAGEQATIWNVSAHPPDVPFGPKLERRPIRTLRRGEAVVGIAYPGKENPDEWFVISGDLENRSGHVAKAEVTVTHRPRT